MVDVGVRSNFFVMTPTLPASVPNGSIFYDSTNANQLSQKDTGGITTSIASGSGLNMFIKQMEASGPIAINKPVSKKPDGKIILADSDGTNTQSFIGFALQAAFVDGDLINVLTVGANITNAVVGLGFAPGDDIFLSETGGFTNDPGSFTGSNDSIIKVGIADCSAGTASNIANDLIIFTEVILRP